MVALLSLDGKVEAMVFVALQKIQLLRFKVRTGRIGYVLVDD